MQRLLKGSYEESVGSKNRQLLILVMRSSLSPLNVHIYIFVNHIACNLSSASHILYTLGSLRKVNTRIMVANEHSEVGHGTESRSQTPNSESDSNTRVRKTARRGTDQSTYHSRPALPQITLSAASGTQAEIPGWRPLEFMMQQPVHQHRTLPHQSKGPSKLGGLSLGQIDDVLTPVRKTKGLKRKKVSAKGSSISLSSAVSEDSSVSPGGRSSPASGLGGNENETNNDDYSSEDSDNDDNNEDEHAVFDQIIPGRRPGQRLWTPKEDLLLFEMFSQTLSEAKRIEIWERYFPNSGRSYESMRRRWRRIDGDHTSRKEYAAKLAQPGFVFNEVEKWSAEEKQYVLELGENDPGGPGTALQNTIPR